MAILQSCAHLPVEPEEKAPPPDPVAEGYYSEALASRAEKDFSRAIRLLLLAVERDPENRLVQNELELLLRSLRSESFYTPEAVRRGAGLAHPLQFVLYHVEGGERHPVHSMPVRFLFTEGSGRLTEEAVTNDLGIALCYVEEITDFTERVVVRAIPVPQVDEDKLLLERLAQAYSFGSVSVLERSYGLVTGFTEGTPPSPETEPLLCAALVEQLSMQGFRNFRCSGGTERGMFERAFAMDGPALRLLANNARVEFLILLQMHTLLSSQPSFDFFFSEAEIRLKIVDAETLALELELSLRERGAGPTREKSEEQAVLKALDQLKERLDIYLIEVRRAHGV